MHAPTHARVHARTKHALTEPHNASSSSYVHVFHTHTHTHTHTISATYQPTVTLQCTIDSQSPGACAVRSLLVCTAARCRWRWRFSSHLDPEGMVSASYCHVIVSPGHVPDWHLPLTFHLSPSDNHRNYSSGKYTTTTTKLEFRLYISLPKSKYWCVCSWVCVCVCVCLKPVAHTDTSQMNLGNLTRQ